MDYLNRIKKISASLSECEHVIIDDPIDLFYLTGLELSLGRLVISREGEATLLVDGRYKEECSEKKVVLVKEWDWKEVMPVSLNGKVGFDALKTSYSGYQHLNKCVSDLIPLQGPVLFQRMIKDDEEIRALRGAGALCMRGYEQVKTWLQEGVSEKEIAVELEIFWRCHGGEKLSFDPIIAFGENSSKPHHRASERRLKKGDIVLIDIGVRAQRYHSDMTRVLFFDDSSDELKKIYDLVDQAQKKALAMCRPGVPIGEVDGAARRFIEKAHFPFIHGLGHGVGLEVHEWPRVREGSPGSERPLEIGMVITIEPGIYLPGKGGVRLEETIVITPSGYESVLTTY